MSAGFRGYQKHLSFGLIPKLIAILESPWPSILLCRTYRTLCHNRDTLNQRLCLMLDVLSLHVGSVRGCDGLRMGLGVNPVQLHFLSNPSGYAGVSAHPVWHGLRPVRTKPEPQQV